MIIDFSNEKSIERVNRLKKFIDQIIELRKTQKKANKMTLIQWRHAISEMMYDDFVGNEDAIHVLESTLLEYCEQGKLTLTTKETQIKLF